jgi:uncharacterized membrane protein YccC
VQHVRRLRVYLLSLMPVLSSISDRVAELQRLDAITPPLQEVLQATSDWVQLGGPENADELQSKITALEHNDPDWGGLLRASLAVRLTELVSIMRHSRVIRRHVVEGDPAPANRVLDAEFVAMETLTHDHGLAFLSALAATVATLLVCAFWIETSWTAGAGAAVIVAVACSFFAAQDDPAPAILLMLRNCLIVTAGVAFYTYAILPRVETFPELALVLLPPAMIIGVLVSRPATFGTGMVMGAIGSTNLALNNGYQGDFAAYVNNSIALIFGLAAALVVTRLIRSVGAAWSARRLLRADWADIAAAAEARGPQDRAVMTGLMMDRLGLLMPRLAAVSPGADLAAADVLHDLRVGLNVIGLQREVLQLPAQAQARIAAVLHGIAAYYRGNPLKPPPESLLEAIDAAICTLAGDPFGHREALMALSGFRSVLFITAPPPELGWPEPGESMRQVA